MGAASAVVRVVVPEKGRCSQLKLGLDSLERRVFGGEARQPDCLHTDEKSPDCEQTGSQRWKVVESSLSF